MNAANLLDAAPLESARFDYRIGRGLLSEVDDKALLKEIIARELDIAIVREPLPQQIPEGLEYFTLSSQRLVAVLPVDHPQAKAPSIALSTLAGDDFLAFLDPEGVGLGHALLELCHDAGFERFADAPHGLERSQGSSGAQAFCGFRTRAALILPAFVLF